MRNVRYVGIFTTILIDGSFVTGKPDPGDIDVVLVLPASLDLSADLPPIAEADAERDPESLGDGGQP